MIKYPNFQSVVDFFGEVGEGKNDDHPSMPLDVSETLPTRIAKTLLSKKVSHEKFNKLKFYRTFWWTTGVEAEVQYPVAEFLNPCKLKIVTGKHYLILPEVKRKDDLWGVRLFKVYFIIESNSVVEVGFPEKGSLKKFFKSDKTEQLTEF